jgi:hypothetical protein
MALKLYYHMGVATKIADLRDATRTAVTTEECDTLRADVLAVAKGLTDAAKGRTRTVADLLAVAAILLARAGRQMPIELGCRGAGDYLTAALKDLEG